MKMFSDTRLHTDAFGRAGLEAEGIAASIIEAPDIVLVGSGSMSSTLAVMLKRLDPRLRIQMFEVTTELASEASEGWNNAGIGHAGICEMSYTPDRDQEGRVPIARALRIFEQFEHSMQFWGASLLARRLCGWLAQQEHCGIANGWKVTKLRRDVEGWQLGLRCAATGEVRDQHVKFVFVGAGGGSLPLLQSTGLAEVAGLGGFPIGGQWLVCDEPAICARHEAKVYGATPPSSPSLGSGHLDVRRLNGQRQLLFGPFASWTTRFLKHSGRWSDLPFSLLANNVTSLLRTAFRNGSLVRYLVKQGLQSMESRMQTVREYYPNARSEHWRLVQAGIRVQAIKKADRGALFFGTELFSSADRSLAALLGASPGASVAVNIAFEVIQTCLPHLFASSAGRERMRQMIPTFDIDLKQPGNAALFETSTREATERLQLCSNQQK